MTRGEKRVAITVDGHEYHYLQPGWWCSLDDPADMDGQLVDEDNAVADLALNTAKAMAKGEVFTPLVIKAIRVNLDLTQREAGEVFGTGSNSFAKYEGGMTTPSQPTKRLLQLALERPELFRKPSRGAAGSPAADQLDIIQQALRQARLDRLYAPLFGH